MHDGSMSFLRRNPCQNRCNWVPAGEVRDGGRVFVCTGCKSEWIRTEAWTPANRDGSITPEVMAERMRGSGEQGSSAHAEMLANLRVDQHFLPGSDPAAR